MFDMISRRNFIKSLIAVPIAIIGTKFLPKKKEFKPSWTCTEGYAVWESPGPVGSGSRYVAIIDKKSMKQLKKDPKWKEIKKV